MKFFARWMRLAMAAVIFAISGASAFAQTAEPGAAKASRAKANPAFDECRKRATALVDTPERRNKESGDVVGHLLFGFGIAGAVITSIKNESDKQKAIDTTEQACLAGKGLAPKVAVTPPDSVVKRTRGERAPVVANGTTAPGATRTCTNTETSCSAAHSYCQNDCSRRNAGSTCRSDCEQASTNCQATGKWKTQNCIKTGMIK